MSEAMKVPEGWKLVPVEPTEEMQRAGGHANSEWLNDNAPIGEVRYAMPMKSVWRDMLDAAPLPIIEACAWNRDDDGIHHTGCGHIFVITDGGLADNEMQFCCYCGLRAEEGLLYPPTTEEDD